MRSTSLSTPRVQAAQDPSDLSLGVTNAKCVGVVGQENWKFDNVYNTWICLRNHQKIKNIPYRLPKKWISHGENKKSSSANPRICRMICLFKSLFLIEPWTKSATQQPNKSKKQFKEARAAPRFLSQMLP